MTKLTLSKQQREHLLEMAKYYFPEHEIVSFHSIQPEHLVFFKYNGSFNGDWMIHWFEFCLVELPKKIFGESLSSSHCLGNISKASDNAAYMISHLHIHPVDYLYEQHLILIKK